MEQLRHPNIIRLYEVVETLAKVHLIMEYAAGGELFTKLSNEGRMTEPEAKFIFAQIISAVEHMVMYKIVCFVIYDIGILVSRLGREIIVIHGLFFFLNLHFYFIS